MIEKLIDRELYLTIKEGLMTELEKWDDIVPKGSVPQCGIFAIRWMATLPDELSKKLTEEVGMPIISNIADECIKSHFTNGTNPEMFFENRTFIPKTLGDYIMSKIWFITLKGSDEIYYYSDGLYVRNGKELIKEMCTRFLDNAFRQSYVNETLEYVRNMTYKDPNEINSEWVNLENGLLNPLTKEFKSHTPNVFSITRIPIKYDPEADCPIWKKSLEERVDNNTILTVQEMFGYCFISGQKYEKAFLLYGPKRTFKSTTLYILENIIGHDNVVAFTLQQINDDSFAAAYLYGKTLNVCADITSKALRDTGRFLTITGGDPITAGKKNRDHITFYPSTKLIFSCNVIPATTNKHPAFYRRWVILRFEKQMPLDEVDHSFREKLKEELPGILNWALDGLKRLEDNGKFSYALSEEEIKDLYERSSDTIQSFIYNEIDTENDEGSLTKREVYNHYKKYCRSNELQAANPILFGRMFIGLTGCGTGRSGSGDKQIPAYKGVNWKSIEEKDRKDSLRDYENTTDEEYEYDKI